MGLVLKPRIGARINYSHPLAKDFIPWLFNEGSGLPKCLLYPDILTTSANPPTWAGGALDFDGTNDIITIADDSRIELGTNWSITIKVRFDQTPGTAGRDFDLVLKAANHAGSEPLVFWADIGVPDHFAFLITDSGATYSGVKYSSFVPLANVDYIITLTFKPNEARLFINGVEDGNSPFALAGVGDMEDSTDPWTLGSNVGNDSGWFDGIYYFFYLHRQTLEPDATKWLHRELYAMFEQPELWEYYAAAVAAAWANKIQGISSPAKVLGVANASIAKILGVD